MELIFDDGVGGGLISLKIVGSLLDVVVNSNSGFDCVDAGGSDIIKEQFPLAANQYPFPVPL